MSEERAYDGSGIVFDFQRCSLNDGHGIRTLVFLKGCPLRCEWCANPESQSPSPQLSFQEDRCVSCQACVSSCPGGEDFAAARAIPWEDCADCAMPCAEGCLYGARKIVGRRMSAGEVLSVLRRDRVFYDNSGGGVTIGGGELSMQAEFSADILRLCKAEGLHTAIETCLFAPWAELERILRHVDLLLLDIKHMDSGAHRGKTGVGNELILANAVKAAAMVGETIVRFPLIPGFNDGMDNVESLGIFVRDRLPSVKRMDILPYHTMGASKSQSIGKDYLYDQSSLNAEEAVQETKRALSKYLSEVCIGG